MKKLANLLQKCVFFALFAGVLCQGAAADAAPIPGGMFYAPVMIAAILIVAAALFIRMIIKSWKRDWGKKDDE